MKKKCLLGLMLLGIVSLFASCVDGDYYDLYDDEEEFFSPRNKKGKEAPNATVDLDIYPLMNDGCSEYNGWFEGECAACFYNKVSGCPDKVAARLAMIIGKYGCFNGESYGAYFYAVINNYGSGNMIQTDVVKNALGWGSLTVTGFGFLFMNFQNRFENGFAMGVIHCGSGHISKVERISYTKQGGNYVFSFDTSDQEGYHQNDSECQLIIGRNNTIISTNIDCFIAPYSLINY